MPLNRHVRSSRLPRFSRFALSRRLRVSVATASTNSSVPSAMDVCAAGQRIERRLFSLLPPPPPHSLVLFVLPRKQPPFRQSTLCLSVCLTVCLSVSPSLSCPCNSERSTTVLAHYFHLPKTASVCTSLLRFTVTAWPNSCRLAAFPVSYLLPPQRCSLVLITVHVLRLLVSDLRLGSVRDDSGKP